MAHEVEIKIVDSNGIITGSLDLTSFDDFPLVLTKGISDINDLNSRSGTYSYTFKLPATKNNNKLLKFVNNINVRNKEEVLARQSCVIFVDNIQIETGQIKVTESDSNDFYNAVFFGDNTDWVSLMSNYNLNELDWRDSVVDFTSNEIQVVRTQDVSTRDINFPYIDRNSDSGADDNQRPVIYAKAFIDAAFSKIGYTVNSNFFDTAEFKTLAFDFAANFTFDKDAITATAIEYYTSGIAPGLDPNSWLSANMIGNLGTQPVPNQRNFYRFPNKFTNLVQDNSLIWDDSTSEYTVQVTGIYNVNIKLNYEFAFWNYVTPAIQQWAIYSQANVSPFVRRPPNFRWHVVANNISDTAIDGAILFSGSGTVQTELNQIQTDFLLTQGDKISIFLELVDDAFGFSQTWNFNGAILNAFPNGSLDKWRLRILDGSTVTIQRKGTVTLGDSFALNEVIPQDVSCLDIIQDFKTLFNLYFSADTYRKTVTIEPRDDFYQNINNAVDWSELIDISDGFNISYASEYKQTLQFRYKADSKDGYLSRWNVINSIAYGKYDQELGTRFDKGTSLIQTKIFAPIVQGQTAAGMFTSVIRKDYNDLNIYGEQTTEYDFRLFNIIREQQFDSAGNPLRTASPTIVTVGLSESFGSSSVPINLNFSGANGLVATYYAKTITNLLSGGVLTVKVNLSNTKFRNIDLTRPVYIDAPSEIKGHYIIQKIEQFNPIKDETTTVELLKYENYTPVSINTNQGGNVPVSVSNPQAPSVGQYVVYIEQTIGGVPLIIPVYLEQNQQITQVIR